MLRLANCRISNESKCTEIQIFFNELFVEGVAHVAGCVIYMLHNGWYTCVRIIFVHAQSNIARNCRVRSLLRFVCVCVFGRRRWNTVGCLLFAICSCCCYGCLPFFLFIRTAINICATINNEQENVFVHVRPVVSIGFEATRQLVRHHIIFQYL